MAMLNVRPKLYLWRILDTTDDKYFRCLVDFEEHSAFVEENSIDAEYLGVYIHTLEYEVTDKLFHVWDRDGYIDALNNDEHNECIEFIFLGNHSDKYLGVYVPE
ncbi:MAG: hypothetical protein GY829_08980 [Gammaproteobacteria bacterium]|nr:hypothetical protein [Gammaproteobacteria bacterium]